MFTMKADTDVERSFPAMEFEHFVIAVIRNLVLKDTVTVACLASLQSGQVDIRGLHKAHFPQG